MKRNDERAFRILAVVSEIPKGKTATYGQIASLCGFPRNAREVGRVLGFSEYYGDYPCHRVVDHSGRLVPHWKEQKALLQEEGVEFKDENHVDLKKCRWK